MPDFVHVPGMVHKIDERAKLAIYVSMLVACMLMTACACLI